MDVSVSEWTPGVGDRQGGLAWCDSWGHTELDTTEQLNWTDTLRVLQTVMYNRSVPSNTVATNPKYLLSTYKETSATKELSF